MQKEYCTRIRHRRLGLGLSGALLRPVRPPGIRTWRCLRFWFAKNHLQSDGAPHCYSRTPGHVDNRPQSGNATTSRQTWLVSRCHDLKQPVLLFRECPGSPVLGRGASPIYAAANMNQRLGRSLEVQIRLALTRLTVRSGSHAPPGLSSCAARDVTCRYWGPGRYAPPGCISHSLAATIDAHPYSRIGSLFYF